MRYFNVILTLCASVGLFSSCSNSYHISGDIRSGFFEGHTLTLRVLQDSVWSIIDSVEVIHGHFNTIGTVKQPQMATLFCQEYALLPLVLEGGNINVILNGHLVEAKGTPMNNKLYGFFDERKELTYQLDDLDQRVANMVVSGYSIDQAQDLVSSQRKAINEVLATQSRTFIKENYNNVLGPNVFMMLCANLPYPKISDNLKSILLEAPEEFKMRPGIKIYALAAQSIADNAIEK